MATINGGLSGLESEVGTVIIPGSSTTAEITTNLSQIYAAYFTPVAGTATYSSALALCVINEEVTTTAGTALGVASVSGAITVAIPATAAAARNFLYTLFGAS